MPDVDINKQIRKEKNKINKLLKDTKIPAHKKKVLEPVIENVATMKVKLDELKEQIVHEEFMVEYDNGGGQKGTRENPIFKRYESFFKTFMIGMDRIISELPDEIPGSGMATIDAMKPKTVLEQVIENNKNSA